MVAALLVVAVVVATLDGAIPSATIAGFVAGDVLLVYFERRLRENAERQPEGRVA